jgi:uncharacterized membrane protein YdjX (TVP38/TMEM64 family)
MRYREEPQAQDSDTEGPAQGSDSPLQSPWPRLIALLLILVALFSLWRWGGPLISFIRDQEQVRNWLAQFGPLAPVVSIILNAAQVLLAPIPGQVIGVANGYLFGILWGTCYSLIGLVLGSALAMALGRVLGRPVVKRFVDRKQLEKWDRLATQLGPTFLFLIYLLPLLPDDVTSFAVGLSPLPIPFILFLSSIGRLPGLVAMSWVGANASAIPPVAWAILIGISLLLAAAVLRYHDIIEDRMLRVTARFAGEQPAEEKQEEGI